MSHGLVFMNPDGSVAIDELSRPPRLIFHERFAHDFSGTRPVPAFDDARGVISVSFGYHKINILSDVNVPDATPFTGYTNLAIDPTSLPDLSWDNTAKILTISAVTEAGTDPFVDGMSHFSVFMVMYR